MSQINPRILFQVYLDRNWPFWGIYFRLHEPSPEIINQLLSCQSDLDFTKFKSALRPYEVSLSKVENFKILKAVNHLEHWKHFHIYPQPLKISKATFSGMTEFNKLNLQTTKSIGSILKDLEKMSIADQMLALQFYGRLHKDNPQFIKRFEKLPNYLEFFKILKAVGKINKMKRVPRAQHQVRGIMGVKCAT